MSRIIFVTYLHELFSITCIHWSMPLSMEPGEALGSVRNEVLIESVHKTAISYQPLSAMATFHGIFISSCQWGI